MCVASAEQVQEVTGFSKGRCCKTVPYSSIGRVSRVESIPSAHSFRVHSRPFPSPPKHPALMATHKYQLLGRDSEKGESTYPVSSGHSSLSTLRPSTSPRNIFLALGAIGAFLLGMISTMAMMTLRSEYHGMGHYETGFREERLRKAANSSHEFHIDSVLPD